MKTKLGKSDGKKKTDLGTRFYKHGLSKKIGKTEY